MDDPKRSPLLATVEGQRLDGPDAAAWRVWGPYLAERQWGTVREDYSAERRCVVLPTARSCTLPRLPWGEDGIAGFCDADQTWCLSLGLWNGADPILKERLFGLTNAEGNHGEDGKELWWHLDAVPTMRGSRCCTAIRRRDFPMRISSPRTHGGGDRRPSNTSWPIPASLPTIGFSMCRWITRRRRRTTS